MSFNIRDYVSDDHIESISEIATGQARIIQALSLDNSQKDKEIARLTFESTKWESKFYDEAKKVDKAIEYIKFNATSNYFDAEKNMFRREIDLLEILCGSDKE